MLAAIQLCIGWPTEQRRHNYVIHSRQSVNNTPRSRRGMRRPWLQVQLRDYRYSWQDMLMKGWLTSAQRRVGI